MSSVTKQRKSSTSSSLLSLASNDVSEMMLPPFLRTDQGTKPELIEHSFRLQRLSDQSLYNLKIKWLENQQSKAEFAHEFKMSIKDIHKSHRSLSRSSSVPVKKERVSKPEPLYISINGADANEKKTNKIITRSIAQVRRDGKIVHMHFRDEHTLTTTLRDIVDTVIRQLDVDGARPHVYLLSNNPHLARPNTTLHYDSLPNWRLSDMVVDPSMELHLAIDFSLELAKRK